LSQDRETSRFALVERADLLPYLSPPHQRGTIAQFGQSRAENKGSQTAMTKPTNLDQTLAIKTPQTPARLALSLAQQAQVAQAVGTINGIVLLKNLEIASEIHRYVLAEFFDGDWEKYMARQSNMPTAYAALLDHQQLRVGRNMLGEWMRVGEQVLRMPGALSERLSVEHHRALLSVPDDSLRMELAQQAVAQSLTAKVLADRVREVLPPRPAFGRPVVPRSFKKLAALHQAAKQIHVEQLAKERPKWTPHQRQTALDRAAQLQQLAAALLAVMADGL